MKTEHYFCDQCKQEVNKVDDKIPLITICFGIGSPHMSSYDYSRFDKHREYALCSKCAEKIGVKLDEKKVEFPPSIETRLYDIMLELVQSCQP